MTKGFSVIFPWSFTAICRLRFLVKQADIAQLVEHLTCNENVLRSIRGIGSRHFRWGSRVVKGIRL